LKTIFKAIVEFQSKNKWIFSWNIIFKLLNILNILL
jgi:hypothetical protein